MGETEKSIEVFAGSIREYINFNVSAKLHDLRTFLVEERHIFGESDTQGWRFLSPTVDDKKVDISEAIIGMESENFITVKDFLYGSNKVRMVNINRKKPDLIGVDVDYLSAGDIEVKISLNSKATPDKFQPVMMENVRPANKDANKSNFVNVVLCEKETAIGFLISSKKHKGFGFSITMREGEPIVEGLYATTSSVGLSMYAKTKNAIEIVSYKDLDIPAKQQVGYRRMTVKAWRLSSYKRDGKSFQIGEARPMSMSHKKDSVSTVSGDSIEGGATKQGKQTDGKIGEISDVDDDPNDVLGTVEIDFFVFKTREDAQHMIDSRVEPIYD